ncbi:MAG: glutathione S-transferase family protein [Pseudomonadota bacterium]
MAQPIRIIGIPASQNVRKPLAVAAHLGIAVENAGVFPQDPMVKEKNPAGRIPVMEEDGFRLGESNAIMIYLASKKPNALYPDDPKTRALVNQYLFWDVAHWTPAYGPIQFERLVKRILNLGEPDEAVIAATLVKFAREAAYLNAALEGRDWLVGSGPTLADFAVGAGLTHADAIDLPYKDYPNIRAFNARVKDLDGFKKTAG